VKCPSNDGKARPTPSDDRASLHGYRSASALAGTFWSSHCDLADLWIGQSPHQLVAAKRVGPPPYFEEIGHTVRAHDPLQTDPDLVTVLTQAHAALGVGYRITVGLPCILVGQPYWRGRNALMMLSILVELFDSEVTVSYDRLTRHQAT
jgi:hypothetical protein